MAMAAAQEGLNAERDAGVPSDVRYWTVCTLWVEVGLRWMRGATVPELTQDYGMFEGNLYRGLLKLSNLLMEWQKMATYCEHVEVLDRLRDAPATAGAKVASSSSEMTSRSELRRTARWPCRLPPNSPASSAAKAPAYKGAAAGTRSNSTKSARLQP